MNRRLVTALIGLSLVGITGASLLHAAVVAGPEQLPASAAKAYLPLTWRGVAKTDLLAPPAFTPAENPLATPTSRAATATQGVDTPTPTPEPATATPEPPTATDVPPTATPTEEPAQGHIRGRYEVGGEPLSEGFGTEGLPQIELHRCAGAECVKVANAISEIGGTFEFKGPAPLAPGEWYEVVWLNTDDLIGREWVYDWHSRRITEYTGVEDIDLGPMEIGNLLLREPCNDCHQTLPITYKWDTRASTRDVYRWSLMQRCDRAERPNAWKSQPLGHRGTYTVASPPPGFRLSIRYCWFIHIEDGTRGTGSSYEQYVTSFLPQP